MGNVGLSTQEAQQRLSQYGKNEIAIVAKKAALDIFVSQFTNVLFLLLFIAAGISFALGDIFDAIFILLIILLNGILGFLQEYRAEQAIAKLTKMTISKTVVIRDGQELEIDSLLLVPGDVIKIEEGDRVPADAKLITAVNLEINEAALTGESLPVFKKEDEEEHNHIFLGTIVTTGRGTAFVENTGIKTRFGAIAKTLSEIIPEVTPLEKQIGVLGKQLGLIAVATSMVVFLVAFFRGEELFFSLLTSISLAVAAVPEGLPAVITITLAVGVHRMAKAKAIVRKMEAIETLGATSLIATDKTGTITKNEMRVREVFVDGKSSVISPLRREASHQSSDSKDLQELLRIGVIANTASLVFKHDRENVDVIGDPTEGALLLSAHELGISPDTVRKEGELLDEFSFDTKRKTMSVIWKEKKETFVYVKGAPETILERSTHIVVDGEGLPLTKERRRAIEEAFTKAASEGFRIIAMAKKHWPIAYSKPTARDDVESNLTFIGFVAIYDPPRPEVKEAAKEAERAGIKTIVITGDNEQTANAVAQEVGLIKEGEDILTGKQLDELTDEALHTILPNVRIFARTTPEQKLRIVKAYQELGFVVAVTGDGVNDALALKQAHVGVAMGTGTDVAKEAADIVVTDDNYATLVRAVEEGRIIFDNIVKSVVYLASGNLGELLIIFLAVLFGMPIPLLPVQILWINLVTDGLPALALAVDPKDPHVMYRKPRTLTHGIIGKANIRFILVAGTLLTACVLILFTISLQILTEAQARTIAFTSLIILHVTIAFFVRGHYRIFSNRFLLISVIVVFFLQILILVVPVLHPIFKIAPLF